MQTPCPLVITEWHTFGYVFHFHVDPGEQKTRFQHNCVAFSHELKHSKLVSLDTPSNPVHHEYQVLLATINLSHCAQTLHPSGHLNIPCSLASSSLVMGSKHLYHPLRRNCLVCHSQQKVQDTECAPRNHRLHFRASVPARYNMRIISPVSVGTQLLLTASHS